MNQWVNHHSQGAVRIRQQLSSHADEAYTSGAFLFISLSSGELKTDCAPFPTSPGCSGAGGAGGGEGVEGREDWGVTEGVMGVDSDSEGDIVCDSKFLESHSSNPNTSYSAMSKSCPVPWEKVVEGMKNIKPVSGLLNEKLNTFCASTEFEQWRLSRCWIW